jgi:hypothetical protein
MHNDRTCQLPNHCARDLRDLCQSSSASRRARAFRSSLASCVDVHASCAAWSASATLSRCNESSQNRSAGDTLCTSPTIVSRGDSVHAMSWRVDSVAFDSRRLHHSFTRFCAALHRRSSGRFAALPRVCRRDVSDDHNTRRLVIDQSNRTACTWLRFRTTLYVRAPDRVDLDGVVLAIMEVVDVATGFFISTRWTSLPRVDRYACPTSGLAARRSSVCSNCR